MTGAPRDTITLAGSTATVTEFFACALSSILYQRGVYPPELFEPKKQHGLTVMAVKDPKLQAYLNTVLAQFSDWLGTGTLQKAVLVISSTRTGESLERWAFDIRTDASAISARVAKEKSAGVISAEIQAIIRQITASITFLPLLSEPCTIDLLAYTSRDSAVPTEWEESDPRHVQKGEAVQLRSFDTTAHRVDALVSYRVDDVVDA